MDHRHGGNFPWDDVSRHGQEAWWYGPFHLVLLLLLIGLLVAGVVWLVRRFSVGPATPATGAGGAAAVPSAGPAVDPAVAVLRMRYAQGEVSRDDYRRAIEDLAAPLDGRDVGAGEDTEPIGS